MAVKKINNNERFMLKGAQRKSGFDRWRLVTNCIKNSTGDECLFFVEFYTVNPSLAPDQILLGFKNRFKKTAEDLQYALAGTKSAQTIAEETYVVPSFVCVKAGFLGPNGKHVNSFFPASQMEIGKNDFIIRLGHNAPGACILSDSFTQGSVAVSSEELKSAPELLCDSGEIQWDLRFEKNFSFVPDFHSKTYNWGTFGVKTTFTGSIFADGQEYTVIPAKSCGLFDKNWGKDFVNPYFHLSSSNLTSIISGKRLNGSTFAVQGEFNKMLTVLSKIEENDVEFHADRGRKYSISYDCSEMPEDEEGPKLHWTVSVHDKHKVLDIDVFCYAREMFLRDYESPAGGRKVLKVLGGGNGWGELRLYNKVKKNLELIEHVRIADALCEYGNIEYPEK